MGCLRLHPWSLRLATKSITACLTQHPWWPGAQQKTQYGRVLPWHRASPRLCLTCVDSQVLSLLTPWQDRHRQRPLGSLYGICLLGQQGQIENFHRQEKWKWKSLSRVQLLWPPGLYSPWNSPDQNTEVGSLYLIQGSSQPRDRTQVSYIAGGFFTSWATREAQEYWSG